MSVLSVEDSTPVTGLSPGARETVPSLAGIVHRRARSAPDRLALTALDRHGELVDRLTEAELDTWARSLAAILRATVEPGDRVLVPAMPGLRFHAAFLACLYANVIAVPVPAIRAAGLARTGRAGPARRLGRLAAICADADPQAAIVPADGLASIAETAAEVPALAGVRWLAAEVDPDRPVAAELAVPDRVGRDTVAFLQYTSGSTSAPRGVMITSGALLANQRIIGEKMSVRPDTCVVSWLPVYHDMGLCSGLLQPLYSGVPAVVMEPETFLARPDVWLRTISGRPDVISAGPDFAYALAAARVGSDVRHTLDLRGWRVAVSGAEPVRAQTIETFMAAFGPCGLSDRAFYPAYGLAESTLFVSGGASDEPPVIRNFSRTQLGHGVAAPAVPGTPDCHRLVGCGNDFGDVSVVVVDPQTHTPCPDGRCGEIWVDSASNGIGYWGHPTASTQMFGATLAGAAAGQYLRTGDLGFLDAGELFIAGRSKDVVIIRGVNYYPQDIELVVNQAHPLLAGGVSAAFAVAADGAAQLTVVAEVIEHSAGPECDAVAAAVVRAIATEFPLQAHVALVGRGRIPRTTSGKVRRARCAELLAAGELKALGRWPRDHR